MSDLVALSYVVDTAMENQTALGVVHVCAGLYTRVSYKHARRPRTDRFRDEGQLAERTNNKFSIRADHSLSLSLSRSLSLSSLISLILLTILAIDEETKRNDFVEWKFL